MSKLLAMFGLRREKTGPDVLCSVSRYEGGCGEGVHGGPGYGGTLRESSARVRWYGGAVGGVPGWCAGMREGDGKFPGGLPDTGECSGISPRGLRDTGEQRGERREAFPDIVSGRSFCPAPAPGVFAGLSFELERRLLVRRLRRLRRFCGSCVIRKRDNGLPTQKGFQFRKSAQSAQSADNNRGVRVKKTSFASPIHRVDN